MLIYIYYSAVASAHYITCRYLPRTLRSPLPPPGRTAPASPHPGHRPRPFPSWGRTPPLKGGRSSPRTAVPGGAAGLAPPSSPVQADERRGGRVGMSVVFLSLGPGHETWAEGQRSVILRAESSPNVPNSARQRVRRTRAAASPPVVAVAPLGFRPAAHWLGLRRRPADCSLCGAVGSSSATRGCTTSDAAPPTDVGPPSLPYS